MDRAVDFKIDSTWSRTNSRQKLDINDMVVDKFRTKSGFQLPDFVGHD